MSKNSTTKILTIKAKDIQVESARKKLNKIKKQTGEGHIYIILRGLSAIENKDKIDY